MILSIDFWTQIVGLVTVCLKGEIVVISLLRSSREIFAKFRGMLVVVEKLPLWPPRQITSIDRCIIPLEGG